MNPLLTERARRLRRDMTDAERRLWQRLRERQIGARFRRQAPIGPYIVDFVAFEQRLVVELDGGQHAEPGHATYDRQRTAFLEGQGFRVLRFWNNEVLTNTEGVLERIWVALRAVAPHPRPLPIANGRSSATPPPQGGDGEETVAVRTEA